MGDTFWMADEVRVEWEDAADDRRRIYREIDKLALNNTLSLLDSQFKDFIFQNGQYPLSSTGSQYLNPVWRQNIIKINSEPPEVRTFMSLN